uniref:Uncharacterized protein n=1 Tax=Moschus moschiferus TaxID=68415 RepID=A0A8C6FFL9_MOSMO
YSNGAMKKIKPCDSMEGEWRGTFRLGVYIQIKFLEKNNKPGQGNRTHRGRNELDLFEEQRSQCGWRVGTRGRDDGGVESPAGLACLEDHGTQVDFLPGQQQAATGSQM